MRSKTPSVLKKKGSFIFLFDFSLSLCYFICMLNIKKKGRGRPKGSVGSYNVEMTIEQLIAMFSDNLKKKIIVNKKSLINSSGELNNKLDTPKTDTSDSTISAKPENKDEEKSSIQFTVY